MKTVVPMQIASDNNVRCARAGIKLAQCSKYMNTTSARAGIKLTQCSKYMHTNTAVCKLKTIGTVNCKLYPEVQQWPIVSAVHHLE